MALAMDLRPSVSPPQTTASSATVVTAPSDGAPKLPKATPHTHVCVRLPAPLLSARHLPTSLPTARAPAPALQLHPVPPLLTHQPKGPPSCTQRDHGLAPPR